MSRILRDMFSLETPLGPNATPITLQETRHKRDFQAVFDDRNFLSQESLKRNPNIILGRRGSGKTAFLYHLQFDGGYAFSTGIESDQIFNEIASEVRKMMLQGQGGDQLVETVARFWRSLLLTTVLCNFQRQLGRRRGVADTAEIKVVEDFLQRTKLLNVRSPRTVLRVLTKLYGTLADKDLDFVWDFFETYVRQQVGFDEAWDAMCALLDANGARGIVLIDSLEQFPVTRLDMREALAGLLHFLGEFDREYRPVQITICLPAELHEEFTNISDNSEKDFEKVLSLHWEPIELFQMCAHRFSIFLKHTDEYGLGFDLLPEKASRDDVWSFWRQFLPREMRNRYGRPEDSVTYISRHTQLLPRHLLTILNKVAMIALAGRTLHGPFHEEDVIRGVRLGENVICEGVLNGFKQKYPLARDVCKALLPNLPKLFDYPTLQRTFKHHGKGLAHGPDDVLELFVRMGVVGKLIDVGDRYDHCRFDYTFNGSMPYSERDRFGVHPAFSGQFSNAHVRNGDSSAPRPVFPIEEFTGGRRGTDVPILY